MAGKSRRSAVIRSQSEPLTGWRRWLANSARLGTQDRRIVNGYAVMCLAPIAALVCLAVVVVTRSIGKVAGFDATFSWFPHWPGPMLQLVALAGVMVMGRRVRASSQARYASIAVPVFMAVPAALMWRSLAVPGMIAGASVVVAVILQLAGRDRA